MIFSHSLFPGSDERHDKEKVAKFLDEAMERGLLVDGVQVNFDLHIRFHIKVLTRFAYPKIFMFTYL